MRQLIRAFGQDLTLRAMKMNLHKKSCHCMRCQGQAAIELEFHSLSELKTHDLAGHSEVHRCSILQWLLVGNE